MAHSVLSEAPLRMGPGSAREGLDSVEAKLGLPNIGSSTSAGMGRLICVVCD